MYSITYSTLYFLNNENVRPTCMCLIILMTQTRQQITDVDLKKARVQPHSSHSTNYTIPTHDDAIQRSATPEQKQLKETDPTVIKVKDHIA